MPSQIYLLSPKLHTQSRGLYSLYRIDSKEEKRPKIIAARQQWVSTGQFKQADKDIKGKKIKAKKKQRRINQQNFLDQNNQLYNNNKKKKSFSDFQNHFLIFILHLSSLEITTSDITDVLRSCRATERWVLQWYKLELDHIIELKKSEAASFI